MNKKKRIETELTAIFTTYFTFFAELTKLTQRK